MKAVRYHSYGGSDVLVYEDADRPVAGAGQVVVKVAGAAFNPVDAAIRAGFLQQVFPVAFPHVPNFDVAGVITEVGEGVSGWSAGAAVVAFLPMTAPGAAAEYVAAPAEVLAAALLQAVAGHQFDVVLNLVRTSPEETAQLVGLVADGGAFVSTTTPGPEDAGRGVRTVRMFARSDASQLAELVARVDAGDLQIEVAGRRPLTDLAAVHDQAAAGRLAGKTVVTP